MSDPLVSPRSVTRSNLQTDRPGERIELVQVPAVPGVQFWDVAQSDRCWSMLHDTYVACLVRGPTAMSARWFSRGKARDIGTGQMQLMEPGEVHSTLHVSEPASFFVAWWSPELLATAAEELDAPGPVRFTHAQSSSVGLAHALQALCREAQDGSSTLALEITVADAIHQLLALETPKGGQMLRSLGGHPAVHRAVEYLRDEVTTNVSLDELAKKSGLSKFHLARSFRETTGLPPHQYQRLLRLQAARRLLERGVPVEECAALTGFADGPHLTRTFRKWVGVPPGSWAKATRRISLPLSA